MKSVAGKLRIELAQYRELEAFAQFASDLDEETTRRLNKGARLVEILKQPHSAPLGFEKQVAVLLAASEGVFEGTTVEKTAEAATAFLAYLSREHALLVETIRTTKEVSDDTKAEFQKACKAFTESHPHYNTLRV